MYIRDQHTQAVINTDDSHYRTILAQREARKKAEELQKTVDSLQNEMGEIRDLLKKVINGNNYG